jgi:glycosyltransferase involved in cell wall biosynthesis
MKISAMVLVGDNEPYLKYCIESIKDIVDEIVFILSESATKIGVPAPKGRAEYNIIVQEEGGINFADWRNQALKECTGDVCLMLDADEILAKHNGDNCSRELLEQIIANNKDAYHIFTFHFLYNYRWIDGRNEGLHHSQCRLFRNDGKVKFEGKVHEYLLREEEIQPEHSGLNKPVTMWVRPSNYGYVNSPCIWHFGGCKGMEDLRVKYELRGKIEGNPFAPEHERFKTNDEYCAAHPLFRMTRPIILWDGNLPKCLKLW